MHFLPSLQILGAYRRVVVEQRFAQHRIGFVDDAVVERRQTLRVLVIGACAELEQRLHSFQTVPLHGAMHRRQTLLRSIIQQRATVHQRYYHLRGFLQRRGQGEGSLCERFIVRLIVVFRYQSIRFTRTEDNEGAGWIDR